MLAPRLACVQACAHLTLCPSSRATRSRTGAGEFDGGAGAGAVTADAGTGAAVAGAGAGEAAGVPVATGGGRIYM